MQGTPFIRPVMGRTTTHMEGNPDAHQAQDQDRQASQPGCRTRCKKIRPSRRMLRAIFGTRRPSTA